MALNLPGPPFVNAGAGELGTLNHTNIFPQPATSHPKTWEIVNFGLWIANWLVGKNPPFAIRNPQCGGFRTNSRTYFKTQRLRISDCRLRMRIVKQFAIRNSQSEAVLKRLLALQKSSRGLLVRPHTIFCIPVHSETRSEFLVDNLQMFDRVSPLVDINTRTLA